MHPGIAPPVVPLSVPSSPFFAIADGTWNHGEGFGAQPIDHGGWFDNTDGTNVTIADVHVEPWVAHQINPPYGSSVMVMWQEGYLRPPSVQLPQTHPIYGYLNGASYVDQGAFEVFKPTSAWPVERPVLETITQNATSPSSVYWPIEAYVVATVPGRSTTLNEQRYMQLTQAITELLVVNDARNPIYPHAGLSPDEIKNNVVVVLIGGSNGAMQSSLAALRFPHLVHGSFGWVINPSYQRLYAEFDLNRALTELTGSGAGLNECGTEDFLMWNQYVWSQGLEMHDMSCLRSFISGTAYRPMCFAVGDEDVTSSGVNWVRVIDGNAWQPHGAVQATSPFGPSAPNTFGWMAGENVRHSYSVGPSINPFSSPPQLAYSTPDVCTDFWPVAIAQRNAELALQPPHQIPVPALTHTPRTEAQQLRGLDDPQEWWLGRLGDDIPAQNPNHQLQLDMAFFDSVNPGFTGNIPGGKEAMFIQDHRVYVGSADGFVTSFVVDEAPPNDIKKPLVKFARSPQLGYQCFAIAPVSGVSAPWVVAATRRHLHKLDKDTLQLSVSVLLPWEVGRPHHIQCADVLTGPGHPGPEIVFASVHGGLCFYDLNLQPILEWPEPGIYDFFVRNGQVTFMSARGLVATVQFDVNDQAQLVQVTKSMATDLGPTYGSVQNPACMGYPLDLELMKADVGATVVEVAASHWVVDVDKNAVRVHALSNLLLGGSLIQLNEQIADIAPCTEANAAPPIGDHLLALLVDGRLCLFDQAGMLQAVTDITKHANGLYPFGRQAHHIIAGELIANTPPPYRDQVVVATNTGLMWLNVNDMLGNAVLPSTGNAQTHQISSGFWVETNQGLSTPLAGTQWQARTNQTMQATWAMSRRPVGAVGSPLDGHLHVLDQRGAYWKIDYNGQAQLWKHEDVSGIRGWSYVGPISDNGLLPLHLLVSSAGLDSFITTWPYCPIDPVKAATESFPSPYAWTGANWLDRPSFQGAVDGFFLHALGGSLVSKAGGRELWDWTGFSTGPDTSGMVNMDQWGNMLQALRMTSSGVIDGIWASTSDAVFAQNTHWKLRSHNSDALLSSQQSIAAVELQGGGTALVLGCPGGRVRVIQPGAMRIDSNLAAHNLGSGAGLLTDHGFGVSALAVKHVTTGGPEQIEIWFGTVASNDKRPALYHDSLASLDDDAVGSGALHKVIWTLGSGLSTVTTWHMKPTVAAPRAAAGVVGLLLADVIAEPPLTPVEEELVVATLSGDIIVYNANTMTEVMRTFVPGGIGCYGSLRAENLGGGPGRELYVAGSCGLWRFIQSGG